MSYLILPKGIPNFSKAVISLWFRVPKASIVSKIQQWKDTPPAFFYVLENIIPLITFGKQQKGIIYEGDPTNVAVFHYDNTGSIIDFPTYHVLATEPVSPSYIGVLCTTDGAFLQFNLQKADHASLSWARINRSRVDLYSEFVEPFPPTGYSAELGSGWTGGGTFFTTMVDTSTSLTGRPEYFYVETKHKITPDHWHHLLLSFDLSLACDTSGTSQSEEIHETVADGTHSYCKLWYAIDDVDYRRGSGDDPFNENMGRFSVEGGDPNGILTENAWTVATHNRGYPNNVAVAAPACNYRGSSLPSSDAELGIPASTAYAEHIRKVEMAELQVFTGVTLDTGITSNRRAFVDQDGTPAKLESSEELIGRKPDILLHGTSDWKAGKNTGSLGINGDDEIKPEGQFRPSGPINKYTPDPSLSGPQTPKPSSRSANARL